MGKTIETPICRIVDALDGNDLDSNLHEGFTIGKKGKQMFWYITWTQYGNAAIYTTDYPMIRRYVSGDQLITIHFK